MCLYKTATVTHQSLKSISKVAFLHRFHCSLNILKSGVSLCSKRLCLSWGFTAQTTHDGPIERSIRINLITLLLDRLRLLYCSRRHFDFFSLVNKIVISCESPAYSYEMTSFSPKIKKSKWEDCEFAWRFSTGGHQGSYREIALT